MLDPFLDRVDCQVMRRSLTTVDPYGWNAEMLAARELQRLHVEVLRKEVED